MLNVYEFSWRDNSDEEHTVLTVASSEEEARERLTVNRYFFLSLALVDVHDLDAIVFVGSDRPEWY